MTTFTDDFNRSDSTSLGAGWVEVSGDWSIVSNQLSPGAAGGTIILRAAGTMASDDHYAQVTIAATTTASQGVWCRGNSNISSGYLFRNNGTSWDLFSVIGGSFTVIGTYTAAAAPGDVAKVQATGSTIKAYVNGVQRVSVTNTGVTTGTSVGIRADSAGALKFDDFAAADVGGGTTGDAAFSGTATLSASGLRAASGTAALAATASMTTSGQRATTGDATLAATASLSADGTLGTSAAAGLAASASLAATSTVSTSGTGQTAITAALAASGTTGTATGATLATTASLTSSGARSTAGDAGLTATGTLTTTGTRAATDSATASVTATLAAAGTVAAVGNGAVTATATLAASGQTAAAGGAAMTATATLAASGTTIMPGTEVEVIAGTPYGLWAVSQPHAPAWSAGTPR